MIIGGASESQASDGTITAGGTAEYICGGQRPAFGFSLYNNSASEDLWFSDSTVAAIDGVGSIKLSPHALYETPMTYRPSNKVSVIAATTGHKFTARFW